MKYLSIALFLLLGAFHWMIKLPFELETEVTGASGFAGTADA